MNEAENNFESNLNMNKIINEVDSYLKVQINIVKWKLLNFT